MSNNREITNLFSRNRAEEYSSDVWQQFVVPLYFEKIDLLEAAKPRIIIGGRGCGKTMLLRYFAHNTQFSPRRTAIPANALRSIGLYWRVDTQFSNTMTGRGMPDQKWGEAFDHFLAISCVLEIVEALKSIEAAPLSLGNKKPLESLKLTRLSAYDEAIGKFEGGLGVYLEKKLAEFELWVSNASKIKEPIFYPGVNFVLAAIKDVADSIPALSDTVFHVFLDEFENLTIFQQRIINSRIKHSKAPLIFNVAMKKRGFATIQTLGDESIVDIADYRRHDLEEYIHENDFVIFAAEVIALHLKLAGLPNVPIIEDFLRNSDYLEGRDCKNYREKLLNFVDGLLPTPSHKRLAAGVFDDSRLREKLKRITAKALKARDSNIDPDLFIDEGFPEESIVSFALLSRSRNRPADILEKFSEMAEGGRNDYTEWTHNNFVGCLLYLYDDSYRECPFYAGFRSFCQLARGNMRHLLELVHKSFSGRIGQLSNYVDGEICIDESTQALAAKQTSIAFLREIRGFGLEGNLLHSFVLRLGSLFALAHRRVTQSEPEITHFAIKKGGRNLEKIEENLLWEAVKWSVLFEVEETKLKEPIERQTSSFEYVLNPIYAPYFNISYRKKRKLELSSEDLGILIRGSYDQVKVLFRKYSDDWSIDVVEESPSLFSHFVDD